MADHKISQAQLDFLVRRHGNEMTSDQAGHYIDAHHRAVDAGHKIDSRRYFKEIGAYADSMTPPRKPAADQPSQNGDSRRFAKPSAGKPRFDGASSPMPRHVSTGRDEFQSLRNKASSGGRYGKKT